MRSWRKNPNNKLFPDKEATEQSKDEIITRAYAGLDGPLALSRMHAVVTVASGPFEELRADVTGPRSILDQLAHDTTSGLSLKGPDPSEAFHLNVPVTANPISWLRWLTALAQLAGQLLTNPEKDSLHITIKVPVQTAIRLHNFSGSITANGQYTTVDANVSYDTFMRLDSITGLRLDAGSGSDVTVQEISGDCRLSLDYDSTLQVDSGYTDSLSLKVGPGCRSTFMALCRTVSYGASYDTELTLGKVHGTLTSSIGSGSVINMTSQNAERLRFDASDDCTVNARGRVGSVSVSIGSDCSINLGAVSQRLVASAGKNCTLATSEGDGTSDVDIKMGTDTVLRLIGSIKRGIITLDYNGDVLVGQLEPGVFTNYVNDMQIRTGYFAT